MRNTSHFSTKLTLTIRKSQKTLKQKDKIITGELKKLYNKFVVVPIHKAVGNGNVTFVYQKH